MNVEAQAVELTEYSREWRRSRPVDNQLTRVARAVEADIGDGEHAQVRERDRAALMPGRPFYLGPRRTRQRFDHRLERRERHHACRDRKHLSHGSPSSFRLIAQEPNQIGFSRWWPGYPSMRCNRPNQELERGTLCPPRQHEQSA